MAPSKRLVAAGVLITLAGLCYSSWVLEFTFPSPLDPMRSFLSELDAAHRPHRGVYVAGDVITAACSTVAAAILLAPRPAVVGATARTSVAAFGVFGAATLADALLPIPGASTEGVGCWFRYARSLRSRATQPAG